MNDTPSMFSTVLNRVANAAGDFATAYINAAAVAEVSKVAAPPQQQFLAGMSQPVNIGGVQLSPWALLVAGVGIIGLVVAVNRG